MPTVGSVSERQVAGMNQAGRSSVGIIGAGLAGLTAARILQNAGPGGLRIRQGARPRRQERQPGAGKTSLSTTVPNTSPPEIRTLSHSRNSV